MPKQFVRDLKPDIPVESCFAVEERKALKQYRGGYFFTLRVGDRTGSIDLKYWGGGEAEVGRKYRSLAGGDVVRVAGRASEYGGVLEIAVNPPSGSVEKTGSYDIADLQKASPRDVGKMKAELKGVIEGVGDARVRLLLKDFFDDAEFLEEYARAPAAASRHHNYAGGLLEHVLSMVRMAECVADIHPGLDRDLLVAGCILHDIGKVAEYEIGPAVAYTDEGRLLGHISIGHKMVAERIARLGEPFPDALRRKILHMILSHHGRLEWGSPVPPRIPEAMALHRIDETDATLKHVLDAVAGGAPEDGWLRTRDRGYVFTG